MTTEVVCDECGTSFERSKNEVNRSKRLSRPLYCSRSCASTVKGRVMTVQEREPNCICAWCQKSFWKKPSSFVNSKHEIYFCSRKCKDEAQRIGGITAIMPPHYGTGNGESKAYRKIAAEHHPQVCIGCNYREIPDILHVHHKDLDRTNSDPSNLEWRCGRCHDEIHFLNGTGKWAKCISKNI